MATFNCIEISTTLASPARGLKVYIQQNAQEDKQAQRHALRETLCQLLELSQTPIHRNELLDLLKIPQHPQLSLSLSHTSAYNAVAWCRLPAHMGIDIEALSRHKHAVLARVSTPLELSLVPREDLLWSCKEAVFKALYPLYKVLSSVEIFDWQALGNETWQFQARDLQSQTPLNGRGEVRLILGHSLAFFLTTP